MGTNRWRWWLRGAAAGLAAVAIGAAAQGDAAAPGSTATQVVEVQVGDTFSSIAARFTGELRTWRRLFHPQRSGLADPALLVVGSQLELVTEPGGRRYLRVVGTAAEPAAGVASAARSAHSTPTAASTPTIAVAPTSVPVARPVPAHVSVPVSAPAAAPTPPTTAADAGLVVGVLPGVAPATVMLQYAGLKRYLERVDGHKVRIVLPTSLKAFFDATMKGEYDLAVAAPHFARVAQLDRQMVPLAMFEPRIAALFVASIDTPISNVTDVRGRAVAFPHAQSLVAMVGQQWLRQHKLEAGLDYAIKGARTDIGVGRLLLSGDAVAAIMSHAEFRSLPADESARLKLVETFARVPNLVVLAHPRLEAARRLRLKTQLKELLADKEDGAAFGRATGFTAIVDADESQLRELDPHVASTRRAMGMAP